MWYKEAGCASCSSFGSIHYSRADLRAVLYIALHSRVFDTYRRSTTVLWWRLIRNAVVRALKSNGISLCSHFTSNTLKGHWGKLELLLCKKTKLLFGVFWACWRSSGSKICICGWEKFNFITFPATLLKVVTYAPKTTGCHRLEANGCLVWLLGSAS